MSDEMIRCVDCGQDFKHSDIADAFRRASEGAASSLLASALAPKSILQDLEKTLEVIPKPSISPCNKGHFEV